jgi:hypothetical protein
VHPGSLVVAIVLVLTGHYRALGRGCLLVTAGSTEEARALDVTVFSEHSKDFGLGFLKLILLYGCLLFRPSLTPVP